MSELVILSVCLYGTLPFAYLILKWIFGRSIMVTIGSWVAVLVFTSAEMYYIIGKFGLVHLAWALPVMFIMGTSIFVYFDLRIKRPLVRAISSITDFSEGRIAVEYHEKKEPKKEVGLLYNAVLKLRKNLKSIVGEVKGSSGLLNDIGGRLASESKVLNLGSNKQASSVQEISATIQEFEMSIEQSKSDAGIASEVTKSAYDKIKVVSENASKSVDINKIIAEKLKIINDIAVQTNILALNAAVEASNAGESGKGFAVVAGEVRKLAEISKNAANDINELTSQSFHIAENAHDVIKDVLDKIENATNLAKGIYNAGIEQKSGIVQINHAIHLLDSVAHNNASSSDLVANNSSIIKEHSDILNSQISFFQTG